MGKKDACCCQFGEPGTCVCWGLAGLGWVWLLSRVSITCALQPQPGKGGKCLMSKRAAWGQTSVMGQGLGEGFCGLGEGLGRTWQPPVGAGCERPGRARRC